MQSFFAKSMYARFQQILLFGHCRDTIKLRKNKDNDTVFVELEPPRSHVQSLFNMLYTGVNPLLQYGKNVKINEKHISDAIVEDLHFKTQYTKGTSDVFASLKCIYGKTFLLLCLPHLLAELMASLGPYFFKLILGQAEASKHEPKWWIYASLFALLFLLVKVLQTIASSFAIEKLSCMRIQVEAYLMNLVYGKVMNMSNLARQEHTVGKILNLMSNDVQRIKHCIESVMTFICSLFRIVGTL